MNWWPKRRGCEVSIRRVNRFEQERGFVTPEGIKRVARARDVSGLSQSVAPSTVAKPLKQVEHAQQHYLVVLHTKAGEISTLDREALYVARALAEGHGSSCVHALILGPAAEHLSWSDYGVDEVIVIEDPSLEHYVPDAKLALVQTHYDRIGPAHVLFVESEHGDADLARRFAVRTGLSFGPDVYEVTQDSVRRACGNGRYQASSALPQVLALQAGTTGDLDLEFVTPGALQQGSAPAVDVSQQSAFSLPSGDVPLVEADFVISAGNGVQNMETFHRLATLLNATVGGSRVVVDDGKLPRERQVGATGQIVKANVYLAIGISGAVQHLQGIKDCNTVIAVNHDESCDMIKRADLAIVADAEAWMQQMIAELEGACA